ncbi:MAG TPA: Glu/Leu/Phe/Val dehydrogenase [Pyrinomonadaceae bacterium]|nr:Glu/Leu/Phe/Val dehydrogenase [Pyrinomonadaceae bacterium]
MEIVEKSVAGYESVALCREPGVGYRGIIALHNTTLGPAVGGTRLWNYASEAAALADALRLARGMTYKNALAGLPLGGGKSVIIADSRASDREALMRAHGRFVETFGGRYVTAEDVGTSPADMEVIRRETRHVAGLPDCSGDPSPVTARGVFRAVQASAKFRWGADDLAGRTVSLQGCGHVGYHLAKFLHESGARLVATDVDASRVARVVEECGAKAVDPDEIYDAEADIFAPCALGAVVSDETLPRLRVEIIVGAANNQLREARHGDALHSRGVLYAPDYVANAGGIINGCIELLGWTSERALAKVDEIYDTLLSIYESARAANVPPHRAADSVAERRLRDASVVS